MKRLKSKKNNAPLVELGHHVDILSGALSKIEVQVNSATVLSILWIVIYAEHTKIWISGGEGREAALAPFVAKPLEEIHRVPLDRLIIGIDRLP